MSTTKKVVEGAFVDESEALPFRAPRGVTPKAAHCVVRQLSSENCSYGFNGGAVAQVKCLLKSKLLTVRGAITCSRQVNSLWAMGVSTYLY